jgi:hypothetical protein
MKPAILAITMLLAGTAVASAQSGPEFCARNAHIARSELGSGYVPVLILLSDGTEVFQRMSPGQWTSCRCFKSGDCDCCYYDVEKVCAEIKRINAGVNRVRLGACEREPL